MKTWLSLLLAGILLTACNTSSTATLRTSGTTPQPTGELVSTEADSTSTSETTNVEADPLDRLLTMRSVKINLTSLHPDGTIRTIDVEIDSAGNMRVKYNRPAVDSTVLPEGVDLSALPTSYEMYVVDGNAFEPTDLDPAWMITPAENDYVKVLSGELHDLDGFTMWLDFLPDGSIQASGDEMVGGIAAYQYVVNGNVDGQTIAGTLRFEPQTNALVKAELHVPAALQSSPDQPQQGEWIFKLNTQLAEVELVTLPAAPAGQLLETPIPTAGSSSTKSGSLAIKDIYPFFITKQTIGTSLTVSSGKVWIGTLTGTIEEVNSQNGTFGKTIPLPGGGNTSRLFPIIKLGFEGQLLWAWGNLDENHRAHPFLFAIDPESGSVVHQWDLDSSGWLGGEERLFSPEDFGISPGKIWMDYHVIDTNTFAVTSDVTMPAMTLFAFNGKDLMWLTGDTGGGDGLIFVSTADLSQHWYQSTWPFLFHTEEGISGVGPSTPMVLAGDRMWLAKSMPGSQQSEPIYTLEAYSSDLDMLMEEKGPLASVPLMDDTQKIKLLYAGGFLWVVYTGGDEAGFLYQLDPQNGMTINSLDLVGDQGRSISDVPMDMASDGDNLWILTSRQLLRIQMP